MQIEGQKDRKEGVSQLGNDLGDNAAVEDGYRYHDVIHLAHATVLGWSAWKSAYFQVFAILLELRKAKGGVVECDLGSRELTFVAGG